MKAVAMIQDSLSQMRLRRSGETPNQYHMDVPANQTYTITGNQLHYLKKDHWETFGQQPQWVLSLPQDQMPATLTAWVYTKEESEGYKLQRSGSVGRGKYVSMNRRSTGWINNLQNASEHCLLVMHFPAQPLENSTPILHSTMVDTMPVLHLSFPCAISNQPMNLTEEAANDIGLVFPVVLVQYLSLRDSLSLALTSKANRAEFKSMLLIPYQMHYTSFHTLPMKDEETEESSYVIPHRIRYLREKETKKDTRDKNPY